MSTQQHILCKSPDLIVLLCYAECSTFDTIYVSNRALTNASPVWLRTLDPESGFRRLPTEEYEGKQLPVLSMDGDDAEAGLILLKIIMNYKLRNLPKVLPYDLLLNMAIICDKYDCSEAVHPWSDFWIQGLLNTQDPLTLGNEGWLRIGYTFRNVDGTTDLIEKLSAQILQECCEWESLTSLRFSRHKTESEDEKCMVQTEDIPSAILEHIWNLREDILESIGNQLISFYQAMQLCDVHTETHHLCDMEECVSQAIGSLVRSLRKVGLPLEPSFDFAKIPLWKVRQQLTGLTCTTIVPWSYVKNCPLQAKIVGDLLPPRNISPSDPPTIGLYIEVIIPGLQLQQALHNKEVEAIAATPIPPYGLPYTSNGSTTNAMALFLQCPTDYDPKPPAEFQGDKPNRCGIADEMQRFHESIAVPFERISGLRLSPSDVHDNNT